MNGLDDNLDQWRRDEEAWWNQHGDYMTYQWQMTPRLHRIVRTDLEGEYVGYLLQPGRRLLDLGCGSGWLSFRFAERGMEVLGIDVSREQINSADALKRQRRAGNVSFCCADFIEWDAVGYAGHFDCVFASAFLHHLPEAELASTLRKIAAIVKPGGRVFLYEPLYSEGKRSMAVRAVDRACTMAMSVLVDRLPRWLGLFSGRHRTELARGYRMTSPHERPIDVQLLKRCCGGDFDIAEIRGWHLHSLGFAMQVTALNEWARRVYEPLAHFWYRLDRFLFWMSGWEAYSMPGRFILCGIKLTRK